MRHLLAAAVLPFLAIGLAGCGNSGAEAAIQEQIGLLNEMADILESDAPPEQLQAKVEDIQKRQKALQERIKGMKITKSEDERLKKKYEPEIKKAMNRLQAAMGNAGGPPLPGFGF